MKKHISFLAIVLCAMLVVTACTNGQTSSNVPNENNSGASSSNSGTVVSNSGEAEIPAVVSELSSEEKDLSYLNHYFNITLSDEVSAEEFSNALKAINPEAELQLSGSLTSAEAIKAAVIGADFSELALSYTKEKTDASLAKSELKADGDYASYTAAAVDTNLISASDAKELLNSSKLSKAMAAKVLMSVADSTGSGRNFIGYSNESDIYGKLQNAWNSFILLDDKALSEIGKNAVENKVTTGYNLKSSAYDARFNPSLTLQYGHDDIKHAHQLIGLLNSEGIVAKVQLEPKTSIYQYLLEWGPVPEATPTYEVKQFGDLYLVNAVEYDLLLEFNTKADMLRFDGIIEKYAKKYEGNEEAKGLIYSSWWQPLYSTTVEDMPAENYHEIYDCVVSNGMYSIHPFALPENLENVETQLKALAGDMEFTAVKRFCNTAFYNYLKGDDFQ